MEIPGVEVTWQLAGILVYIATAIGRKFNWVADDRLSKQLLALGFAILTVVAWPALAGQPIPALGILLVSILQTWLSAMATSQLVKTAVVLNKPDEVTKPAAKKATAKKVVK